MTDRRKKRLLGRAVETVRLVQHTDDEVAAFLEHRVVFLDEARVAVEGGDQPR